MVGEKSKKGCLPSILMLTGFLLFILTAIAIPSMAENSRNTGVIVAFVSLFIFLAGFILAFIMPFLQKRKSKK